MRTPSGNESGAEADFGSVNCLRPPVVMSVAERVRNERRLSGNGALPLRIAVGGE